MSNFQISSTDLGLYHQKALYNWFFMHKKKYFEDKNGGKKCLQGELNPGLLRDRPSSWPLDHVVTNEIEKKILWSL